MSIIENIFETVLGGGALALLFFLIREKCFPFPSIEGRWFIETKTIVTEYNPYMNMILIYEIMIWREGNTIKGTAEKIYENSSGKKGDYTGKNRTQSKIEGNIEKRYFGKDRIYLHFVEQGFKRESTAIFELIYKGKFRNRDKATMSGKFYSTAGDSNGKAHARKKRSPYYFML
ncbi:MAG: hypothetical protein OXE94_08095 [Aestuariivita sp.]|nr:hypothetical protein [Aestuariivita sp.]